MDFTETQIIPINDSKSPRRKRADAVANRCLILETAEKLFCEQGLENVSMAAIAKAAGVGKGTLYRAFANKGELCFALLDEDLRQFQDLQLADFRANFAQPPLTRLNHFIDRIVHFLDKHTALMREVQTQGVFQELPNIHSTVLHRWFHDTTYHLLLEAADRGDLNPELDLRYAADALLAPLTPQLFAYQRQIQGLPLEQISHGLRGLMFNGLVFRQDSGAAD